MCSRKFFVAGEIWSVFIGGARDAARKTTAGSGSSPELDVMFPT